ncbi:N-acetylneuraminate synthase family protein [Bdellovibrio sp. HCB2-146]|uniref:N-acetylneuraminate synthase family protein n=1 Tax=Bdellovibrio sp. HCB2-146 TaxID=3394362 RepID=UPI0039BCA895
MHQPSKVIQIEERKIGLDHPTYFIADIAANHDGDLNRAIDLIYLAKEAGADVAKFQHFAAETIVSDFGFKNLGSQQSHQAKWNKSVFEVYKDASLNPDWTGILKETCVKAGITFFTSPYSLDLVDEVDRFVEAYKIGSGDITWTEIIEKMVSKKKPLLLATGASTQLEVDNVMKMLLQRTPDIILMQCNTNYTASLENFKYINLRVLNEYARRYPSVILGLSDHTPGHAAVLGAVTLGARVVEKHFTDSNERVGPDHKFALNPKAWSEMVHRTRELEYALGDGTKVIEENEKQTVVLQRRSIRVKADLPSGHILKSDDVECLRPCPEGAIPPYELKRVIGSKLKNKIVKGQHIAWGDLES